MKHKYIFFIVLSVTGFFGVVGVDHSMSNSQDDLKLTLRASKEAYKLGEKIDFSIRLSNTGKTNLHLMDEFGTGTGFLHLECTKNGKDFFGCSDPSWGTLDFVNPTTRLKSGETIFTSTSILWDWKVQDVPTYIFLESNVYYVTARYTAHLQNENGEIVQYELKSEPIKIEIMEPQGEDLEVWNKIKEDGNFAYLIQYGEIRIPSYKTEERVKFTQKVWEIISTKPNSFYAQSLHASLEKFKASEAKRKAFQEQIKQRQKPDQRK